MHEEKGRSLSGTTFFLAFYFLDKKHKKTTKPNRKHFLSQQSNREGKTTGTLLLSGAKSQESREILGRTFFVNGLNNYCELKLLL